MEEATPRNYLSTSTARIHFMPGPLNYDKYRKYVGTYHLAAGSAPEAEGKRRAAGWWRLLRCDLAKYFTSVSTPCHLQTYKSTNLCHVF
eukprot:6212111-Pleurochrysis_carterae.AAC.6